MTVHSTPGHQDALAGAEPHKRVNLNLLYVFDAVMTEQHVTRASERLGMTQSAVSNALASLREVFKDQLFVKAARGVHATPRANALWPRVRQMLEDIQETVEPRTFNASGSQRQFRVAMADITTSMMVPYLYRLVHAEAPQASVCIVPHDSQPGSGPRLMRGEIDFVLGLNPARVSVIESMPLWSDTWVVAGRPGHPLLERKLSLAAYCSTPQLTVNESGDETIPNMVDDALTQRGLARNIQLTVNQFSVVTALLQTSDLIATLPAKFVATESSNGGLSTKPVPFSIPDAVVYLSWHRRSDASPSLSWFKQRLLGAATALNVSLDEGAVLAK